MKRHIVDAKAGRAEITEQDMTPAEEAAFEAARSGPMSSDLPEETGTQIDDLERALLAKGVLTAAEIAAAKQAR